MKFVIATLLVALTAVPAFAQMKGRGHSEQKDGASASSAKRQKVDEAAYQRALKSIPDSKEKVDPWQQMR